MLIKELLRSITVVTFSFVLIGTINAKSTKLPQKPMLSNKVIASILPPGGKIVAGIDKDEFFILSTNETQHKIVAATNHKTLVSDHKTLANLKHSKAILGAKKKLASLHRHPVQIKTVAAKSQHLAQKNGKHLAMKHNTPKKIALGKVHHKTYS